jgi:hypothetical protein
MRSRRGSKMHRCEKCYIYRGGEAGASSAENQEYGFVRCFSCPPGDDERSAGLSDWSSEGDEDT